MIAQGTARESDYVTSSFLEARPLVIIFGLLLSCVVPLVLYRAVGAVSSLGIVVLSLIFLILSLRLTAKRNFRRESDPVKPMAFELREEGLFFKREDEEGRLVPWSDFVKWKKTRKVVLLYPTTGTSLFLIPSHFFKTDAQFDRFLTIVTSKLGKASW